MTVLNTLYTALVVVWGGSELWLGWYRRSGDRNRSQDHGTLRLLQWTIYLCIFLGVWFSYAHFWPVPATTQHLLTPLGLLLMVLGLDFRWRAIRVLGRHFTVDVTIGEDHQIVRSGPYRWLRHPSYTGALATFLGFALCQGDGISLLIILIPVFAVFLRRIHIEEAALAQAFPIEYPAYARQTRRLLPGIW